MPEIDATGTDYAQYSWSRYQVSHGIVVIGLIYACFNRDSCDWYRLCIFQLRSLQLDPTSSIHILLEIFATGSDDA